MMTTRTNVRFGRVTQSNVKCTVIVRTLDSAYTREDVPFSGKGKPLRDGGMMIAQLEATAGQRTHFDGHGFASKRKLGERDAVWRPGQTLPRAVSVASLK